MEEEQVMRLVYGLGVLVLLAPAFLALWRRMPRSDFLRNLVVWLAAFAALGLVYRAFGPF